MLNAYKILNRVLLDDISVYGKLLMVYLLLKRDSNGDCETTAKEVCYDLKITSEQFETGLNDLINRRYIEYSVYCDNEETNYHTFKIFEVSYDW